MCISSGGLKYQNLNSLTSMVYYVSGRFFSRFCINVQVKNEILMTLKNLYFHVETQDFSLRDSFPEMYVMRLADCAMG